MKMYDTFNDILVMLFKDIMKIEEKALMTDEFKDITNNDMHIIEAVGIGDRLNMSTISKSLSVTVGTLTINVNSLVKKGYVERIRSEEDRRVVYLVLTDKGRNAYTHHEEFHKTMVEALLRDLSQEDKKVLVSALSRLRDYFKNWEGDTHE